MNDGNGVGGGGGVGVGSLGGEGGLQIVKKMEPLVVKKRSQECSTTCLTGWLSLTKNPHIDTKDYLIWEIYVLVVTTKFISYIIDIWSFSTVFF